MTKKPLWADAPLQPPLARGRTAEIYAWEQGQVLKLFYPSFAQSAVQYEADVARQVQATGLRVPAVGAVVEAAGRSGILYERIAGKPLMDQLRRQPRQSARQLGELHAQVHAQLGATLPNQRQRLVRRITEAQPLPAELRAWVLDQLAAQPDGAQLCHGDFHPQNVLLTPNGPIIIDWVDATQGNPLADIARTLTLLRFAGLSIRPVSRWFESQVRRWLSAVYLRAYRRERAVDQGELQRWLIPIVAARLAENVTDEEPHLLRYLHAVRREMKG